MKKLQHLKNERECVEKIRDSKAKELEISAIAKSKLFIDLKFIII